MSQLLPAEGSTQKPSTNGILSLNNLVIVLTFYCAFRVIYTYFANDFAAGGGEFKTGDWLINYSSGFVRRGLIGQGMMSLSLTGQSLLGAVFTIQSALYAAVCILYLRLFFAAGGDFRSSYFLFSPAGMLLFPLNDPHAALRKEMLVYLAHLVILIALTSGKSAFSRRIFMIVSFFMYSIALFSHELTAFVLPFFLFALFKRLSRNEESRVVIFIAIASWTLVTLIGLSLAVVYRGDEGAVSVICNSLTSRGLSAKLCGGAVGWLAGTSTTVKEHFSQFGRFYYGYLVIGILTLLPFFPWKGKVQRRFFWQLLICAICLSPLFVVAIDWGRWIHIYFVLSSQLLFADYLNEDKKLPHWKPWFILIYCLCWGIPHYCPDWSCYKIGVLR